MTRFRDDDGFPVDQIQTAHGTVTLPPSRREIVERRAITALDRLQTATVITREILRRHPAGPYVAATFAVVLLLLVTLIARWIL